ncbi:BgTH12-01128 [Blumeria graminis f. sp. triticale]|nr:BgTH12-01128 [Blumeria graminis f. sp. triticale]
MGDLENILLRNQNWSNREWKNIKKTIENLLDDIPQAWINARNSTGSEHTNTAGQILLNMAKPTLVGSFAMCYSACKRNNGGNAPARSALLMETLQEARKITGCLTSEKQLWAALWNTSLTPKTCDFIWRLLHNLIRVGEDLGWLPEEKKSCPYCRSRLNISHILLHCPGCIPVWTCIGNIGTKLGQEFTVHPKSIAQLIALIYASPGDTPNAKGRGQLLTSLVIWSLWKNHLRWSIDGHLDAITPENTIGLAIKQLTSCFHRDRVISMTYRYTGHKMTATKFRHYWGIEPWKVSTFHRPWFIPD